MLIIGLTGGVGSGKSTVTACFEALGVPCCDADQVARELTQSGTQALAEIIAVFGADMLDEQQRLKRARLRQVIFADAGKRKQLEAILHPRIRQAMRDWIASQSAPYVIVAIPLLAESQQPYPLDRVLVVDIDEERQIERAAHRDGVSENEIRTIMRAQAGRSARLALADDIINNNGTLEQLQRQVNDLHRKYLRLSGRHAD